ncbi:hypothetical protein FTUN_3927 [Frigoriglobus tundricola]|uniref:Uncharacterized protein n=1 Tax=Frigoriglobus tundricola TaxID=2774151 RepID=A0A6M5YSH8_9BACT|nr:hypothetical protein FTUN_3927 [Frigoriglobus tundricola]
MHRVPHSKPDSGLQVATRGGAFGYTGPNCFGRNQPGPAPMTEDYITKAHRSHQDTQRRQPRGN